MLYFCLCFLCFCKLPQIKLFFSDDEDDYLTISSNDELDQAIQAIPVGACNLKLYVKCKCIYIYT